MSAHKDNIIQSVMALNLDMAPDHNTQPHHGSNNGASSPGPPKGEVHACPLTGIVPLSHAVIWHTVIHDGQDVLCEPEAGEVCQCHLFCAMYMQVYLQSALCKIQMAQGRAYTIMPTPQKSRQHSSSNPPSCSSVIRPKNLTSHSKLIRFWHSNSTAQKTGMPTGSTMVSLGELPCFTVVQTYGDM